MSQNNTDNSPQKKDTEKPGTRRMKKEMRRQKIVISVLSAVILLGAAAVFAYQMGWIGKGGQEKQPVPTANVDPSAEDWNGTIPEAPKGNPNSETISIPGYPKIYLPADKTDAEVTFGNPEGNPCYFTFRLFLKDTNEVLYESGQIPPGEAVSKISLSRPLEKGEYQAVLKITTASIVDQSAMNGAEMETVLVVK